MESCVGCGQMLPLLAIALELYKAPAVPASAVGVTLLLLSICAGTAGLGCTSNVWLKRRNPCTGAKTSECTRGLENSAVYHRTNSPRALNVKVSVKTREHDSCREHCISREPPGTTSGKGYYSPNMFLSMALERRVVRLESSPGLHHQKRGAGFSF